MPAPRWLKLALLGYVSVWFGVVLPGHKRGQITLPGARAAVAGCCTTAIPLARHATSSHHVPLPPPSRGPCAICFFAAHLSVAPPVDVAHAPLAFLHLRAVPAVARPLPQPVRLTYDGRAPPLLSPD